MARLNGDAPGHADTEVAREPQAEPPIPGEVAERAVEWFVELSGEGVADSVLCDWQRWRAQHPDHERAWQRIESVNHRLRDWAAPVGAALTRATLTEAGTRRRRQALKALSLLLFGGGALWLVEKPLSWRQLRADQRTAVGERRRIELKDGSLLVLNTDSALDVAYSAGQRRLNLLSGEVSIATARDTASRPFLIETVHGDIQALGTRFAVRVREATTEVSVFEGAVRIAPRRTSGTQPVLRAGQRLRFSAQGAGAPQTVDADATAWIDGFIVAKGLRLDEFLAELGRYSERALSCDAQVAGLRVSGSYPVADIDRVLQALATTLSLRIETVDRLWGPRAMRLLPAVA